MLKQPITAVEQDIVKFNNKRLIITLVQDATGTYYVHLITHRLVSFKERNISTNESFYSIETFAILQDMMHNFATHHTVTNLLQKELSNLPDVRLATSLSFDKYAS